MTAPSPEPDPVGECLERINASMARLADWLERLNAEQAAQHTQRMER